VNIGERSIDTKVLITQLFRKSFDKHAHLDGRSLVYFNLDLFSNLVLIEEILKLCVECLGIMDIMWLKLVVIFSGVLLLFLLLEILLIFTFFNCVFAVEGRFDFLFRVIVAASGFLTIYYVAFTISRRKLAHLP
jgi:hypothetical protein